MNKIKSFSHSDTPARTTTCENQLIPDCLLADGFVDEYTLMEFIGRVIIFFIFHDVFFYHYIKIYINIYIYIYNKH